MAKRTRYPGRPATRPGARRPGGGPTARPAGSAGAAASAAGSRIGGLTEAEIERAAEIERELVAREQAAIAENARRRARIAKTEAGVAANPNEPLSVRASHEYAYVARDVKRIGLTAGLMFSILAAIWVLVNVVGVGAA
ncbi:MAG TPA: hypothetical protein VFO50_05470 [Candidatus Limnocylindrales bacterium]|nr:hypothetical protein [Candidatus Limnocylindrales bacterium]